MEEAGKQIDSFANNLFANIEYLHVHFPNVGPFRYAT